MSIGVVLVVAELSLIVTGVVILRVIDLVRVEVLPIVPVGIIVVFPVLHVIVILSSIGASTFSTLPSSVRMSKRRLLVVLTQDEVERFCHLRQLQSWCT